MEAAEREAAEKKAAKEVAEKKKNCEQAKAQVARAQSGVTHQLRTTTRVRSMYLNDAEIAQEIARAQQVADSWCK